MMLCGMGKYGRVMTQYIGIVYDVIFLLLVLGAAEAGRRRGFASGLVSLIGSVAGIIGGTYGTRVWAGGIYDKYVASHVTDVVADTLEKTGGDLAQAIHALTFLPQSIQQKLIDTVSAASSNAVPQVVNALYGPNGVVRRDQWERLPGSYHGSGCTLASAIAGCIAGGANIEDAVRDAQDYTWNTLKNGFRAGMGQFIPDRFYWARDDNETGDAKQADAQD